MSGGLEAFRRRHPVTRDIPVAWGEMDAFGHVNNTVFFRYFETARIALFEQADFVDPGRNGGVAPILSATECRFRAPLHYPDTVTAGTWVQDLEPDRFVMGYALYSHSLDRIAAEGSGRIVAYDYDRQRKARLGPDLHERLSALVRRD